MLILHQECTLVVKWKAQCQYHGRVNAWTAFGGAISPGMYEYTILGLYWVIPENIHTSPQIQFFHPSPSGQQNALSCFVHKYNLL